MEDKFDAIIIGGGLAGLCAGYVMAKEGLEVLLIERGNFCGGKNMSGGRLYSHSIEKLFPDFATTAPIEREIRHEKITFMDEHASFSLDYDAPKMRSKSYSVLRVKLDAWLAQQAEDVGLNIINSICVDELIMQEGKCLGVRADGEEMYANTILLAQGANPTLAFKHGLCKSPSPHHYAVGVKEIIQLDEKLINDRFACDEKSGTSWLFAGLPSDALMGGGFLYTNKSSLSLGVVFGLHNINKASKSVPQMLEDFKAHPSIAPLIKDGKSVEYSAHIVPEGGLAMMPKLYGDGYLLAGDSAGLCLNLGYTIKGMDLAVESGIQAGKAIIAAKQKDDYSANSLKIYEDLLKESFVLKDMQSYASLPAFLQNERIFKAYPKAVLNLLGDVFYTDEAKPLKKKIFTMCKEIGFVNLIKDLFQGGRAI